MRYACRRHERCSGKWCWIFWKAQVSLWCKWSGKPEKHPKNHWGTLEGSWTSLKFSPVAFPCIQFERLSTFIGRLDKLDFPKASLRILGLLWNLHTWIWFNAKSMKSNLFPAFPRMVETRVVDQTHTPFIFSTNQSRVIICHIQERSHIPTSIVF